MNLKTVRFLKGMTQAELQQRSGIDQAIISKIERGYYVPRPDQKLKLEKALDAADLIDWHQAEKAKTK